MNALNRNFLHQAVSAQSGICRNMLNPATADKMVDRTLAQLRGSLFGQDIALTRLCDVLRSQAAQRFLGWNHAVETGCPNWDRRPWACLLAVGPTGTGKTDTARCLADSLFDGRLITLHCSEVGPEAPHAISTWTGSPPGYVGHGLGGLLTNGMRLHRTAVLLFDEIEKAAPEAVQNIFLPLLGKGTVTDRNNGETLWATDCVVFCTSNLGVESGETCVLGFGRAESAPENEEQRLIDRLGRYLHPEVLARFNGILDYRSLNLETKWKVWLSLHQDLILKIGPGTQIVIAAAAKRFIQERLAEMTGGARAIIDLFRREIIPLAVGTKQGDVIRVTIGETNRLQRLLLVKAVPLDDERCQERGGSHAKQDSDQNVQSN